MKKSIKLIDINKLRSHEEVDLKHVNELVCKIRKDGFLRNPVIVEDKHLVILDGHHRFMALKKLRMRVIPSYLVPYGKVKVFLRRKIDIANIKKEVISHALNHKLFPSKTTRHLIKNRPRNINVNLANLQLTS